MIIFDTTFFFFFFIIDKWGTQLVSHEPMNSHFISYCESRRYL